MTLQDIIASLPKRNWIDRVDLLRKHKGYTLTNTDVKCLLDELGSHISADRSQRAVDLMTFALVLDQGRFLDGLKRSGLLRPSRYSFLKSWIRSAIEQVLTISSSDISQQSVSYLQSTCALCVLSRQTARLLRHCEALLKHGREVCLKSLLVTLDWLFMAMGLHGQSSLETTLFPYEVCPLRERHLPPVAAGL